MSRVNIITVGRVIALLLLLIAMAGPWFYDSHPATEASCLAPLVWLGNGHCACLVSLLAAFWVSVSLGQGLLWMLCLLQTIPFLSTVLILLGGERRFYRIFHLTAWGLTAAFSNFLFIGIWYSNRALRLWGAGLSGVVAVISLAGELLVARLRNHDIVVGDFNLERIREPGKKTKK
jgi:hypothetical protein